MQTSRKKTKETNHSKEQVESLDRKGILTFADNAGPSDLVVESPSDARFGTRKRRSKNSGSDSGAHSCSTGSHGRSSAPEAFPRSETTQRYRRSRPSRAPLFSPEHALTPLSAPCQPQNSLQEAHSPSQLRRRRGAEHSIQHRAFVSKENQEEDFPSNGIMAEVQGLLKDLAQSYFKQDWLQRSSPVVWYIEIILYPAVASNSISSACGGGYGVRKLLFLMFFCLLALLYRRSKHEYYQLTVVGLSTLQVLGSFSYGNLIIGPFSLCIILRLFCYFTF